MALLRPRLALPEIFSGDGIVALLRRPCRRRAKFRIHHVGLNTPPLSTAWGSRGRRCHTSKQASDERSGVTIVRERPKRASVEIVAREVSSILRS